MELNLLDLLNREPLRFPSTDLPEGVRRVVVTGAGGSIGSAVVKRLIGKAEFVGMIGHSEAPIFRLQQALAGNHAGTDVEARIVSVGNHPERWIDDWEPDLIIHAAAHKHVGLMSTQPDAALSNNTMNTIALANAAYAMGVPKFVFISTDKAADPTTVMGASKRLAEAFLLSRSPYASVCRFGNVIGSSGSVVEIFHDRLQQGQPVNLTAPGMKRYFITPDEAVSLVLASARTGPGLYSLDMGEQVLISTIIERMGAQMGVTPQVNITNPVAGEKEDEKLFNEGETVSTVFWDFKPTNLLSIGTNLNPYRINKVLAAVQAGKLDIVDGARGL